MKDIISCIKDTIKDEMKPIHSDLNNLKTNYELQNTKFKYLYDGLNNVNEKCVLMDELKNTITTLKEEFINLKSEIDTLKKTGICEKTKNINIVENITLEIID